MQQDNIEQFMRTVAKAPLSLLLLDYDGTLAPFSVDRQQALPYPGLRDLLQQIMKTGRTRLVIVTGRDAREIGPLLAVQPGPEVWGAHGLQRLRTDGTCEMPKIPPYVAGVLDEAKRWLGYQGLQNLAEIKPGSIAVHWRALQETDAIELRGRILVGWFPIAERGFLKLLEFDGGLEMRMPDMDKSRAVRTLLAEVGPGVPAAYLGDDATDEHAFRALGQSGLTLLVRSMPRRTSAHVWLRPPEELLDFLSRWRDATETGPLARSATN